MPKWHKNLILFASFRRLKINGSNISESSCQGDFLRITFGGCNDPSVKAYSLFCGTKIPEDVILSTTNKLCLKFFSDDSGSEKGFSLTYTSMKKLDETSRILGNQIFPFLYCMISWWISRVLHTGVFLLFLGVYVDPASYSMPF